MRFMKTLKKNSLGILMHLVLVAIFLSACGDTGSQQINELENDMPEMSIHEAVLTGNLEVVEKHIEAGTNINEVEPMSGSTPLISAATFDKKDIAEALIKAGADLTIANNDGNTPLHSAAFFGRVEIVQLLIDAKADKTLRNNFGATPRETVMGPFSEIKPVYEMMQQQLAPLGMQLDMEQLEKTRPVIAMMLQ